MASTRFTEQQLNVTNDEAERLELSNRFLINEDDEIILVDSEYEEFDGSHVVADEHVSIGYIIAFAHGGAFGHSLGQRSERIARDAAAAASPDSATDNIPF